MPVLDSALSGMRVSQKQIELESRNMSGSLTPGYMAIEAQEYTVIQGTSGNGVQMSSTYRSLPVESFLITNNRELTQENALHQTLSQSLSRLEYLLGRNKEDTNMGSLLQDVLNAYSELTGSGSSQENQEAVIRNLSTISSFLSETSQKALALRRESESSIDQSVKIINQQIEKIQFLNQQILERGGTNTADVESQRDEELRVLAQHIDVKVVVRPLGEMHLYSQNGDALLEDSRTNFRFYITPGLSYDSTYPATANPLELVMPSGNVVDATHNFSSGSVVGNLIMRDKEIPNIQEELNELARNLKEIINSVNNLGTPFSPQSTLEGTRSFAAQGLLTPFQGQGTFRAAILDANQSLVGFHDVLLGNMNTIGDIVNDLQNNLGAIDSNVAVALAGANTSFTLTTTTPGNSFAFTAIGGIAEETTTGKNLSHYLGLNDLVTSTDESSKALASSLAVKGRQFLSYGQLSQALLPQVGDLMLHKEDSSAAVLMVDALQKEQTFQAAGNLGTRQQTLVQYSASIVTDLASRTALESKKADGIGDQLNESAVTLADAGGVSTMDSIQRMLQHLNRYVACTKSLEVYQKLFDTLLNIT
jgi:flagellar hook-associated protein 1 FlgK